MAESLILRKGGGISAYANLTAGEGIEVDTSAYVGGILFLHTACAHTTGGITYASSYKTIQGWNGSAWVTLCSSSIGGSGSDVWLRDEDFAIITDNIYTKIKASGAMNYAPKGDRFHSAYGAK